MRVCVCKGGGVFQLTDVINAFLRVDGSGGITVDGYVVCAYME